jgi:Skp family chaperone for outer membrane proteins
MNALAVPANSDVSPIESGSAATTVAAVNVRQLLEQAPPTEYALNALTVELGARRDKLISMQRDLKAHLERFKHTRTYLKIAKHE